MRSPARAPFFFTTAAVRLPNGPAVNLRAAHACVRRSGAPAAATNAQHEAICSRRDAVKLPLGEGLQPRARHSAARQVHRLVRRRSHSPAPFDLLLGRPLKRYALLS